ncbi:hypothetical protein NAV26_09060 [Pseudomonas stutzeri]|uniref:hypothetical protein n=1 Tax=Stutzerimonas stutzeri TaxID=316 RepID=UPI00210C8BDA|nr:hypothetical protein [Stutzerimonas stutzeri]MCQ4325113.1 hypothetical protein [Stutzerimonas stutzeri]
MAGSSVRRGIPGVWLKNRPSAGRSRQIIATAGRWLAPALPGSSVTSTGLHLAQRIGHALESAYDGELAS